MLRLANMTDDFNICGEREKYLSKEISLTIAYAISEALTHDVRGVIDCVGMETFKGMGAYCEKSDEWFAAEFCRCAMSSTSAKVLDKDKCYRLNLLELFLLYKIANHLNPDERSGHEEYFANCYARAIVIRKNLTEQFYTDPLALELYVDQIPYIYKLLNEKDLTGTFYFGDNHKIFDGGMAPACCFIADKFGLQFLGSMFEAIGMDCPLDELDVTLFRCFLPDDKKD